MAEEEFIDEVAASYVAELAVFALFIFDPEREVGLVEFEEFVTNGSVGVSAGKLDVHRHGDALQ